METRKSFRYGINVVESVVGEQMRRAGCLCVSAPDQDNPGCARLVTAEDVVGAVVGPESVTLERINEIKRAFNCPTAQANFDNCVKSGVAAPITRCPMYVPRVK